VTGFCWGQNAFSPQYSCEKDLEPDNDQDDAAENGCLVGKLCSEFFPYDQSGHTDDKGHCGNEWANRALFDYQGNALPALEVVKDYKHD